MGRIRERQAVQSAGKMLLVARTKARRAIWHVGRSFQSAARSPSRLRDAIDIYFAGRFAQPGSKAWLIRIESVYGGPISNVVRRTVSRHDPRTPERLRRGGMKGGDRMARANHNYASTYARELRPFVGQPVTLVEVGILRGSGLAIWCDLFPEGRIVGLDIDLSHFAEHREVLAARGAFRWNAPIVECFDAYEPDPGVLDRTLGERKVDIVVDDGPHSVEPIVATAHALQPHLAERFVYIVEDNPSAAEELAHVFNTGDARAEDGLVVVKPRS